MTGIPRSESLFPCGRLAPNAVTRRQWLRSSGQGLGAIALAALWGEDGRLVAADGTPAFPRRPAGPAKNVIVIHHGGGLSHVDSFDPKPLLAKLAGKAVPDSIAQNVPKTNRLRLANLHPSPFSFQQHGHSGLWISSLFPQLARHADRLCVIRSMRHESVVHPAADYVTLTGSLLGTRPSLGAWIAYGLGSENRDLSAFINLVHGEHFSGPAVWSAGFLPARYQATTIDAERGMPHTAPASGPAAQRRQLDLLAKLNARHRHRHGEIDELDARTEAYELAFRMQSAAPEAFDVSRETKATQQLYGIDDSRTQGFGRHCLLARRLIERGVRFVQLIQAGWDAHEDVKANHTRQGFIADRPIAALLGDLSARGLLDETLVVCGGEFGRTPTVEGDPKKPGRDHSPTAYSAWLAGAGIRGGQTIGATDDIGYTVTQRPVHPNDLHATMLKALGLDQHELYFEHHNRREIVTVNGGTVISEALA